MNNAKEVIEDLLEAIPKQDNDHDWWDDDLTHAVENAKKFIASESITDGVDEDELWDEVVKDCEAFIIDVGTRNREEIVIGGNAVLRLRSKFHITKK